MQELETKPKYTFFWHGPLSNWAPSEFVFNGIKFNCGEQYMMFTKAALFEDLEMMAEIMSTTSPRLQKEYGRKVKGYSDEVWMPVCVELMARGLYAKFTQNEHSKNALLATVGTEIVEASPMDIVWGVGLAAEDPRIQDKSQWRGTNFLGIVLMMVREMILKDLGIEKLPE